MNLATGENITIREAKDEDAECISNLIFNIWVNEHSFDVTRENFPDLREIEKYYANGLFLVAIANEKIVGTIACDQLADRQFALKRMFVSKDFRGAGVAQQLLNRLLEQMTAKNGNCPSFFLSTKESQAIAAKKFYLRNGFRVISKSELPKNFPFFYKDDLFMLRSSGKSD